MNKSQIEKQIKETELQLARLKDVAALSPVCAELYNKAILEKAILKEELKKLTNPAIIKFADKLRTILPVGEKRICDYFKS